MSRPVLPAHLTLRNGIREKHLVGPGWGDRAGSAGSVSAGYRIEVAG